MTYDGYLSYGGNELINSERARGYAQTAACPMFWFKDTPVPTLRTAVGDTVEYDQALISEAPWYDSTIDDISRRFYGVYGLSIDGLEDSTRSVNVIQGIGDGGQIGRQRLSMRTVKITALIVGRGQDAVEYGLSWLNAQLDPDACGQVSEDCGTAQIAAFAVAPPVQTAVPPETAAAYSARIDLARRFMRNTGTVSGAFKKSEMQSSGFWAYTVQWVMVGGPNVIGTTVVLDLQPVLPSVVQDTPFNLVPTPSAETAGTTVLVGENRSTNPSLDVNATDWTTVTATISGSAPTSFLTSGVSTDIAADGVQSYRARILGSGASAQSGVADLDVYSEGALAAGSNRRCSFNMWTALLNLGGGTLTSLTVSYEFFNGVTSLGAATTIGSISAGEFGGKAVSVAGVAVPATATKVRVRSRARVSWASLAAPGAGNSDIRLYADALAITVP